MWVEDRCQLLVEDKTTESFSKAVNNYLDFAWISTIRDVCGTVEWEATSNTRGSWFKSSDQKALMEHSILYWFENLKSNVNRLRTNLPLLCKTEAFLFNIYDIFSSKTKKANWQGYIKSNDMLKCTSNVTPHRQNHGRGSGPGTVGRVITYYLRNLQFECSCWQYLLKQFQVCAGLEVSELAFFYDDQCSNSAEDYSVSILWNCL